MEPNAAFVEASHCPHNPDFECASCATIRHDDEHPDDVDGCRVCFFRGEIYISTAAMPNRERKVAPWREPKNSWERGIAKDERGMPLLKANGSPIPIKEYGEKRRHYEGIRERLRNTPSPASPKE